MREEYYGFKMLSFTQGLLLVAAAGYVHSLHPCCVSKIYFAKLKISRGEVDAMGHTTMTENKLDFEYDADLQMDRAAGTIYNANMQTSNSYLVINDFKHMHSYTMTDDVTCTKATIDPDDLPPHCVPPTLMWTGEYTVGSSAQDMKINSWNGMYNNYTYSMQTTVNDCTPVSMTRFGMDPDGKRVMENILYVNVTQYHHSNPAVFDLPIQCKGQMPDPVGK